MTAIDVHPDPDADAPGSSTSGAAWLAQSSTNGHGVLDSKFTRASNVAPRNPSWLPSAMGRGWVTRTGLTILAGMQDLGKTGLALTTVATVTQRSNVLVFSAEDDPETTLAPRLIAAGADMDRVWFFNETEDFWLTESSTGILDSALKESRAKLVLFDPLLAYFTSGTDSHRDRDVRAVLRRVNAVSQHRRAALFGNMHFNKADHAEILHYVSSSIAFTAAPRSVIVMVPKIDADDDPDEVLVIHAKCNVAPKQRSQVFRRESVQLDPPLDRIHTYRMVPVGMSDITAANYIARRQDADTPQKGSDSALESAMRCLAAFLLEGPREVTDIKEWVAANAVSWMTARRAKDELGIIPFSEGNTYMWRMPDAAPTF